MENQLTYGVPDAAGIFPGRSLRTSFHDPKCFCNILHSSAGWAYDRGIKSNIVLKLKQHLFVAANSKE
jgi:hypothetical protein